MSAAEREISKELPQDKLPRSANYVARLVDLSPEALDISKPFSVKKLNVSSEVYQVLDGVSAADSRSYWKNQERKGTEGYDSQMRSFTDSWVQAIKTEYSRDQTQIDSVGEAERRKHEGSLEVLDRLGLDATNLDASNIQQFYDRYFRNGRNTSQFVTDMQKLFTQDQIKQNIDTIRFVAEMFDAETAADIAGILLLEVEDDKKGFAEKANKQSGVTNKQEQQRLTKLSRYRHPVKADAKSKQDMLVVDEEPQITVLDGQKELEQIGDRISIGGDDANVKVLNSKDEIEAMKKRIAERRAAESHAGTVSLGDEQVAVHAHADHGTIDDIMSQIKPEQSAEMGIVSKEFPPDVELKGESGDGLGIVIHPDLLKKMNKDIVERSRGEDGGHKQEAGGFILGRRYKDPNTGIEWTEVADFVNAPELTASSASVVYTPESFRKVNDYIHSSDGNNDLSIVGYVHSHPPGIMGEMSRIDEALNEIFSGTGQFALVLGLGSDVEDISENLDLNRLHAFFSPKGAGDEQPGGFKKHKGIYFTSRDIAGLPEVAKVRIIGELILAPQVQELANMRSGSA